MSGCMPEETEAEKRIETVKECKEYIAECEYMISMLDIDKDHYAVMVKVRGVEIGVVDGSGPKVVELLKYQISEAEKCIDGLPNKYE